mmetsp:Transcript_84205/g.171714  ORF Transcript_84205/g.171714 Transcript_84205/m.171714 type:complete len:200 (-) Transcript_84205:628-1227(-)
MPNSHSKANQLHQPSKHLKFLVPLKPGTGPAIGHAARAIRNRHAPRQQGAPADGHEDEVKIQNCTHFFAHPCRFQCGKIHHGPSSIRLVVRQRCGASEGPNDHLIRSGRHWDLRGRMRGHGPLEAHHCLSGEHRTRGTGNRHSARWFRVRSHPIALHLSITADEGIASTTGATRHRDRRALREADAQPTGRATRDLDVH